MQREFCFLWGVLDSFLRGGGFAGGSLGEAVSVVWRERFMEAKMLPGKILFMRARTEGSDTQM